jgi:predicted Zn-dependent protease
VIGSMILGAIALSKNPQAAQGLIVGGQAAAIQSQLSYSRDMEREADRVGYGVMADAGYDPQGFVGMFGKLQQAAGLNDSGTFPYLRSHPLTTERIADMQARQQLLSPGTAAPGDMTQALMSARARVMSQNSPDALKAWVQDAEQALPQDTPAQRAGKLYAGTLAHLQQRNMAEADRMLALLQRWVDTRTSAAPGPFEAGHLPAQRWVNLLAVEVAMQQGRFGAALDFLLQTTPAQSLPRPELIAAAQAVLRVPAHPAMAKLTQQLRDRVFVAPHDAQAWNSLADLLAVQLALVAAVSMGGKPKVSSGSQMAALGTMNQL